MILLNLPVASLFHVRAVSRPMRVAVDTSLAVQQKMFLKPHDSMHLRIPREWADARSIPPPPETTMWCYKPSDKDERQPEAGQVIMRFYKLPRVGAQRRRMLVASPPICKMSVQVSCCWSPSLASESGAGAPKKVHNPQGVVLGDLLDMAKRLFDEHRYCSHAPSSTIKKMAP